MSWKYTFLKHFGPSGLCGITLRDWWRLLVDNRFAVDLPYLGRALAITSNSLQNSVCSRLERIRYGAAIEAATVQPPLFVLGVWRSGTTHLHNLLCQDERFAFPNTYQVLYPKTFLTTESWNSRILQFFMPAQRPQDNVRMGVDQPQEDEFAMIAMTRLSFALGWAFPRRQRYYERYLTLNQASEAEVEQWKNGLMLFLKKLSLKYDRPLILKSPAHTGRIKTLLELFPDAKFVHIHRNPLEVFASTLHTVRKVVELWTLQRTSFANEVERAIDEYRQVTDAFFDQQALIPQDHLCDIAFADLDRDPVETLRRVYVELGLGDFSETEPGVRNYLGTLGDYKKNRFPPIESELKERIVSNCQRCFDIWGYEPSAHGADHAFNH